MELRQRYGGVPRSRDGALTLRASWAMRHGAGGRTETSPQLRLDPSALADEDREGRVRPLQLLVVVDDKVPARGSWHERRE